jgi:hypothetical protein
MHLGLQESWEWNPEQFVEIWFLFESWLCHTSMEGGSNLVFHVVLGNLPKPNMWDIRIRTFEWPRCCGHVLGSGAARFLAVYICVSCQMVGLNVSVCSSVWVFASVFRKVA